MSEFDCQRLESTLQTMLRRGQPEHVIMNCAFPQGEAVLAKVKHRQGDFRFEIRRSHDVLSNGEEGTANLRPVAYCSLNGEHELFHRIHDTACELTSRLLWRCSLYFERDTFQDSPSAIWNYHSFCCLCDIFLYLSLAVYRTSSAVTSRSPCSTLYIC